MSQFTLSVPNDKLSMLKEFLDHSGIEEKYNASDVAATYSARPARSANNSTKERSQLFTWEYNCNELEFE